MLAEPAVLALSLAYLGLLFAVAWFGDRHARTWSASRLAPLVYALSLGIVLASYLHNFVLGPRVQAEVREQRPQKTRPILVVVGYVSLALTITVPILGAILAKLAAGPVHLIERNCHEA